MDNLTHSLIGVALSRAGLNRLTPQAGWLMLLASNVPDIDIVSGLKGSLFYLECHRGWTHSFTGAPLVALVPLLLWWWLTRKRARTRLDWIGAYAASLAGVVSHLVMDWMNIYGIRLWLPFNNTWPRLDLLNIVDIWIWVILLIAVVAPWLARLVSSEIGAKSGSGRGAAWVSLVLLVAYLGFRASLHAQALQILDSRTHLDRVAQRVAAFPTAVSPWQWTGVAETSDFYRVYSIDLLKDFDPDRARTLYRVSSSTALDVAKRTESVTGFLRFSQFPFWRIVPSPDGKGGVDAQLSDLRFGMPEDQRFVVTVKMDASQRVTQEGFAFGNPQPK